MFTLRDGRDYLYAWDLNRQIIVDDPSITEVHFSNRTDDRSLVVEVKDEGGLRVANIPNIILQQPWDIIAYAYCPESYTKIEEVLEVKARPKPDDYIYTETEVYTVEEHLSRAIDEAKANGEFKGDKGDKGDTGPQGHPGPKGDTTDLTGYATKQQVDNDFNGKQDLVYHDFPYANQEEAPATDEHAKIFDRILSGEQLAVYSKANPGVTTESMYVATEFNVYNHYNMINFIAHYTNPITSSKVLSVIRHTVRKINNRWEINRNNNEITNIATDKYVDEAIANINITQVDLTG